MAKANGRAGRAREEAAPYAAVPSGVVVMPWSTLEVGIRYMEELKKKAGLVSEALHRAGIPHAVIGGLAVAANVARVDDRATRNTRDLNVLLERADLDRAARALKPMGFSYRKILGIPAFVLPRKPGVKSRFREAVHLVWAGERTRPGDLCPAPSLAQAGVLVTADGYTCLDVASLLAMKLTSFRLKDQVHIQDLLALGMITPAVRKALPQVLLPRLAQVEEITRREALP